MQPILKKFLAGKPIGMMSKAAISALLDAARSALLASEKIKKEIEDLKIEALQTGPSHEVFNQAELPHASEIIAKAEACLAKGAARKSGMIARPGFLENAKGKNRPLPVVGNLSTMVDKPANERQARPPAKATTLPSALIPVKAITTLPAPKKSAPAKAAAPTPPATPTLDKMNLLTGIQRQQFIKANQKAIATEQGIVRRWNDDRQQNYGKHSQYKKTASNIRKITRNR